MFSIIFQRGTVLCLFPFFSRLRPVRICSFGMKCISSIPPTIFAENLITFQYLLRDIFSELYRHPVSTFFIFFHKISVLLILFMSLELLCRVLTLFTYELIYVHSEVNNY